jgi:rRNA maturation endonuclease Nob1
VILDPKVHVMMCSGCRHLNEVTRDTCERCGHDAGTPLFRDSAERLRDLYTRLAAETSHAPA